MRALYLDPDFVLAHFALGNLHQSLGHAGRPSAILKMCCCCHAVIRRTKPCRKRMG